jgi:hypothetical protein
MHGDATRGKAHTTAAAAAADTTTQGVGVSGRPQQQWRRRQSRWPAAAKPVAGPSSSGWPQQQWQRRRQRGAGDRRDRCHLLLQLLHLRLGTLGALPPLLLVRAHLGVDRLEELRLACAGRQLLLLGGEGLLCHLEPPHAAPKVRAHPGSASGSGGGSTQAQQKQQAGALSRRACSWVN